MEPIIIEGALFQLGALVATPAALAALRSAALQVGSFVQRHASGDWSEMGADDATANTIAMFTRRRIFSCYRLPDGERLFVITEADRSSTTVLLGRDY